MRKIDQEKQSYDADDVSNSVSASPLSTAFGVQSQGNLDVWLAALVRIIFRILGQLLQSKVIEYKNK